MHHSRPDRSPRRLGGLLLVLLVGTLAVAGSTAAAAAAERLAPSPPATPIDINHASAEQLTALPGVGPALAERIVAFRKEHGPFQRVEDLMKVKGIGEKSFQKLRPHVRVGDKS